MRSVPIPKQSITINPEDRYGFAPVVVFLPQPNALRVDQHQTLQAFFEDHDLIQRDVCHRIFPVCHRTFLVYHRTFGVFERSFFSQNDLFLVVRLCILVGRFICKSGIGGFAVLLRHDPEYSCTPKLGTTE
ncbi:hypothetical protein KCU87_g538, partial [Aureobasidium melanogenum]